jgi:acyl-CoA thioesterase FadM
MSEVLSTWPVVVELPLRAEDLDPDGFLTDEAVVRLFAEARRAYAEVCPELDLESADLTDVVVRPGAVAAPGALARVGVAVVEVFPETFTMEARVRPEQGAGIAATASCVVAPAGGVTDGLRSRLIALAQTARHHH